MKEGREEETKVRQSGHEVKEWQPDRKGVRGRKSWERTKKNEVRSEEKEEGKLKKEKKGAKKEGSKVKQRSDKRGPRPVGS